MIEQLQVISLLQHRERNWQKRTETLWNWSCGVCGDSARNARKARLFCSRKDDGLVLFCHNCGFSGSLYTYCRLIHPDLAQKITVSNIERSAATSLTYNVDDLLDTLPADVLDVVMYGDLYRSDRSGWLRQIRKLKMSIGRKRMQKLITTLGEKNGT